LQEKFAGEDTWRSYCFVMLHEWGHLQGRWHSMDDWTVMAANAIQPTECMNPVDAAKFNGTPPNPPRPLNAPSKTAHTT
jgi:hypothetical protein